MGMPLTLIGGHPAIDFLNTSFQPGDERIELLPDGQALLEWLRAAGLLGAAETSALARRVGVTALDGAADEVRCFREWAREWLSRWRGQPSGDHAAELRHLDAILASTSLHWKLLQTREGIARIEQVPITSAEQLVGRVAVEVARLVSLEDPLRVKCCAGQGCTLWFLDRTKASRRRFCSASGCGNRAKVHAFRQRQREGQ